MADMANIDQVEDCWEQLGEICGTNPDADGKQQIVPVTYMNSSAALKAFCGRHGGIVCTSSNAHAVLEWAFARGKRVLFFPDQHLGRNTALAMGMSFDQMPVWNPYKPAGGAEDPSVYADTKMILWKGFCSVHQRFTVDQIERARKAYPGVKVIVHPRMLDGRRQRGGWHRLYRVHRQGDRQRAGWFGRRSRHGNQPRQPSCRAVSGQDRVLPRSGGLPMLHDVPHSPRISGVGVGEH